MPTMDFLHPSLIILARKAAKAGMKKVDGFWAYTNSEKDGDVLDVLITLKIFNPVACLVKQMYCGSVSKGSNQGSSIFIQVHYWSIGAINWSAANVARNITNIRRASHPHAR